MASGPLGHIHVHALQPGLQISLDMTVTLRNILFIFMSSTLICYNDVSFVLQ